MFIHCSASDRPEHDNVDVIRQWHLDRGWSDVGYHYFIQSNGNIQQGRDLESNPAAQAGNNQGTIAICLHGLTHFSVESLEALKDFCREINKQIPMVTFHGHCEVSAKACPVFDYRKILSLDKDGQMLESLSVDDFYNVKNDMPLLKLFDHTAGVGILQNLLGIKVDCVFGQLTKQAVIEFQRKNYLIADGIVGPQTWSAFYS